MSLFAIADTHLSLGSAKPKNMDVFGGRWRGYTEKLEKRWRAVVGENDTVVVAGDFSWADDLAGAAEDFKFIDALPGRKLISKGNHDHYFSTAAKLKRFLDELNVSSVDFLHNNAFNVGGMTVCGTRGWYSDAERQSDTDKADFDKLTAREAARLESSLKEGVKLGGEILVFTHFPVATPDFKSRALIDILHGYSVKRVFYGHLHGNYSAVSPYIFEDIEFRLISADYLDFIPYKIMPH